MEAFDEGTELFSQPKRRGEKILVRWMLYKDHPYIDLRLWTESPNGSWHPSAKGFTLPPDQLLIFGTRIVDAARSLQRDDGVNR